MPIYAYRCSSCGHAKDMLRKVSDPALTTCPACGADSFQKQVTAAGFQLKGSGWYATDFKGGGGTSSAGSAGGDAAKADAPAAAADSGSGASAGSSSSAGGCGSGCACH